MGKLRIPFLAVVFGSVFFFLGKTILSLSASNKVVNTTFTPFVFPTHVPLPGWQQLSSSPLPVSLTPPTTDAPTANRQKNIAGRQYHYVQSNRFLDIRMFYVVNTSGGFSMKSAVKNYSSRDPSQSQPSVVLRHDGAGSYNLFIVQQRAYLNACINPHGSSTATKLQFMLNRYLYDVRPERLLSWLLGKAPYIDKRCLWAHLSIPLNNSSPEDAYRILETAWFSSYQWWSPRFPKP